MRKDTILRLAKFLSQAGIASRRQGEELIGQGQVKVNGLIITELGYQVNPELDQVEFAGTIIKHTQTPVYILLNKPPGYICSSSDPQGRPTILDLVKDIRQRIYPVGRLDFDTAGLIILSNDGEFTNLMIHPRYKIEKRYEAWVAGRVEESELQTIRAGILLDDGPASPAECVVLKQQKNKSLLEIKIHEGRKRQVKRMCAAIDHPVIHLKRTGIAFLTLNGLKEGKYRHLSPAEVAELKKCAGQP